MRCKGHSSSAGLQSFNLRIGRVTNGRQCQNLLSAMKRFEQFLSHFSVKAKFGAVTFSLPVQPHTHHTPPRRCLHQQSSLNLLWASPSSLPLLSNCVFKGRAPTGQTFRIKGINAFRLLLALSRLVFKALHKGLKCTDLTNNWSYMPTFLCLFLSSNFCLTDKVLLSLSSRVTEAISQLPFPSHTTAFSPRWLKGLNSVIHTSTSVKLFMTFTDKRYCQIKAGILTMYCFILAPLHCSVIAQVELQSHQMSVYSYFFLGLFYSPLLQWPHRLE